MTNTPTPAATPRATPFKKPLALHVRIADGSCYLQMGEINEPPFMAFDVGCDEEHAAFIAEAVNAYAAQSALIAEMERALVDSSHEIERARQELQRLLDGVVTIDNTSAGQRYSIVESIGGLHGQSAANRALLHRAREAKKGGV